MGFQCAECFGGPAGPGMQRARRGVTVAGAELAERAVLVPTLIGVNVLVFLLTAVQGGGAGADQVVQSPVYGELALAPWLVTGGEWWRLLTYGFVHLGLTHIAFNMLSLWFVGRELERVFGRARFLVVYMISILGGGVGVMLFEPQGAAGASGAVFGLLGAILVMLLRLRQPPGQILFWIGLNVAFSVLVPNISLAGHLGGLVVGAAAAAILVYAPPRNRTTWQASGLTTLLLLLVLVATAA